LASSPPVPGAPSASPSSAKSAASKPKTPKALSSGYPKSLKAFVWDRTAVPGEIAAFNAFLAANPEFGERSHALPFFQANHHFCGFIGLCAGSLAQPDRIAYELNLGGNYRPDFVVGCSTTKSALFVELEDGKKTSFFADPGDDKATLAPRVLGAVSQIVDWSFQLSQLNAAGYTAVLGFNPAEITYLIVCGRKSAITNPVEQLRYDWVTNAVTVSGRTVQIQTYDDLQELVRMHQSPYGF
jgi:hypothetical protein